MRVRLGAAAALGLRGAALNRRDGIRNVIGRKRLRNRLQGGSHRGRHRAADVVGVVVVANTTATVDHCRYRSYWYRYGWYCRYLDVRHFDPVLRSVVSNKRTP